MNSLETEYSFLAPTWKLPPVGSPAVYPGTYGIAYSPSPSKLTPNASIRNTTMPNPRYVPPNGNQRNHPQPGKRPMQFAPPAPPPQSNGQHRNNGQFNNTFDMNDQYETSIQSQSNGYPDNRGFNYPPPPPPPPSQTIPKRVQIIDHNRQTPSSEHMSEREIQNSPSPDYTQRQPMPKPRRDHPEENKSDSFTSNVKRPNNFKIHEYLYGLAAPDPGSYVSAFKNQRRRLEDEKANRKTVLAEYKNFVQNGGFGPAFGNVDYMKYEEKVDTEKKRKSYSKIVREVNQFKVEEHKRIQNNGGQQRNRNYVVPLPKHRRPEAVRSNFLSPQESLSTLRHISNSPALREDSFNNLHPWNQTDVLSGEFYVDRYPIESPENSSKTIARNVRFVPEVLDDNKQAPMPSLTTTTITKITSNDSIATKNSTVN